MTCSVELNQTYWLKAESTMKIVTYLKFFCQPNSSEAGAHGMFEIRVVFIPLQPVN